MECVTIEAKSDKYDIKPWQWKMTVVEYISFIKETNAVTNVFRL
jgi:hypothetical protein